MSYHNSCGAAFRPLCRCVITCIGFQVLAHLETCRIFVCHVDDITIGIRLQVLFQIYPAGQQGCPAFLLTKSDKPDTIKQLLCNIVAFWLREEIAPWS